MEGAKGQSMGTPWWLPLPGQAGWTWLQLASSLFYSHEALSEGLL